MCICRFISRRIEQIYTKKKQEFPNHYAFVIRVESVWEVGIYIQCVCLLCPLSLHYPMYAIPILNLLPFVIDMYSDVNLSALLTVKQVNCNEL